MKEFKRFIENVFLSYKSIYGWMSLRTYIFMVVLIPFSQTALFSYLNYFIKGEAGMKYAALGNSLYTICIFVVFSMGASITNERRLGTLQTILFAPQNKFIFFITKSVLHIVEGIVTCCFSLLIGTILFKLDYSDVNWFYMAVVIFTTASMMIGVGLFAAVAGLLFRKATPILNAIVLLLFLLCGINFPTSKLPGVLQLVSNAIPLTYGIRLLRAVYSKGEIFTMDFLNLCLTGIIFFIVSYSVFKISEAYSRKRGTLDYY